MILYCDTSSLVKLYIEEYHSADVHILVREADIVATCCVALPEMVSALTRRFNNRQLNQQGYQALLQSVRNDWRHIVSLDFDELLAANLAERHGLRGFDAVHLASALKLAAREQVSVQFSAFDEQLVRVASAEGLTVVAV